MNPFPIRPALFLLAVLGFAAAGRCDAPTPDDEARFLAGLPVPNSPLATLASQAAWTAHAADFDKEWAQLDKHQLQTIQAWAPGALGHFYSDAGPVYYLYSGPDFLYAHAFFPNASTYILCGIEPIGPLPQVENLPPQALAPALSTLRDSMDSLFDFSFFITKKMKTELQADSRLSGTLPVLYVFLARAGCKIIDVSFTNLDATGQFTTAKTLAPCVKIAFTGPTGANQTLYYFSTDLSDGPVEKSAFLTWCSGLAPARGFLKAASYLMHNDGFSTSRKFLLANCSAILQDDSGIPMRYFTPADWTIQLFGTYKGPIPTFKDFHQEELDKLMTQQKPKPLDFSVGYRWHSGESSLIFAVKSDQAAAPGASASPAPDGSPASTGSAATTGSAAPSPTVKPQ